MVKDNSIREQMFASIASWQSSELSQKQWCQHTGNNLSCFSLLVPEVPGWSIRSQLVIILLFG